MKIERILLIVVSIITLVLIFCLYVYLGTYVFPIAPYWITQLPPNPPSPKIKHGEFDFKLEYNINNERKIVEDTFICDFDGFEVISIGDFKTRKWKGHYKNENNNEIFTFRNVQSKRTQIVLETIGECKIVLGIASAEYFLGEPNYKITPDMPSIQVYETSTGYYKNPNKSKEFLNQYNFKVIKWYCDPPIKNTFK